MTLQDSPSLSDFSDGYTPPPDPDKGIKRARVIIGLISLLILGLGMINFTQSDLAVKYARKGSIAGFAVDETGNPIQVEVLVFNTNISVHSDQVGYFVIKNVPGGEQSIIVAYGNIAAEKKVVVAPGTENNLGMVTMPTDLLIFVDK